MKKAARITYNGLPAVILPASSAASALEALSLFGREYLCEVVTREASGALPKSFALVFSDLETADTICYFIMKSAD